MVNKLNLINNTLSKYHAYVYRYVHSNTGALDNNLLERRAINY